MGLWTLRRVVSRSVPRAVPLFRFPLRSPLLSTLVRRSVPCSVTRFVPRSVLNSVPRSVCGSVPRSVPCFILFIVDKKVLSSIFSLLLTDDNWTCSTPLISYRSKICWKAHWPKIKKNDVKLMCCKLKLLKSYSNKPERVFVFSWRALLTKKNYAN